MPTVFETYGSHCDVPSVMDRIPVALHAAIVAGTSTDDVSSYINAALADYKLLRLPLSGQISIGSTLRVPSGGGLVGVGYGCTIKALPNFGNHPMVGNVTTAPATNAARDKNLTFTGFRIDGNKANNSTATEFSHGIKLQAVDGANLDVQVVNPKGDGVSLQQASEDHQTVGCANITGKIRTHACNRQGLAIVCGEQIDLDVYDTAGNLLSVDLEPDHPSNFIRNIFIRLLSIGTGNGSDISGGVCVAGDGQGCLPTNVTVDFQIINSGGYGALWRDAQGLILRGNVLNPTHAGLVGVDGGSGGSTVLFEGVRITSPGTSAFVARETVGSVYDGSISIEGAAGAGIQINNARGGTLGLTVKNTGQQGVTLDAVQGMTFPNMIVEASASHGLWLRGNSSGNRFPGLKSVNSSFGWGVLEESGCNDNKALFARVAANGAGNVSMSGAGSLVQAEP